MELWEGEDDHENDDKVDDDHEKDENEYSDHGMKIMIILK